MTYAVRSVWSLALTLAFCACGRNTPPTAAAPPASTPPASVAPVADGDAAARAARAAAEAAETARLEAERTRTVLQQVVFFDYDDAGIRDDAARLLDEKAPLLRNAPTIRLRIEGHADERGSSEYNLALASRRALSVASYLAGHGVETSRLETVSFGEERPRVRGSGETAWGQNRRAEFVITSGMAAAPDERQP